MPRPGLENGFGAATRVAFLGDRAGRLQATAGTNPTPTQDATSLPRRTRVGSALADSAGQGSWPASGSFCPACRAAVLAVIFRIQLRPDHSSFLGQAAVPVPATAVLLPADRYRRRNRRRALLRGGGRSSWPLRRLPICLFIGFVVGTFPSLSPPGRQEGSYRLALGDHGARRHRDLRHHADRRAVDDLCHPQPAHLAASVRRADRPGRHRPA